MVVSRSTCEPPPISSEVLVICKQALNCLNIWFVEYGLCTNITTTTQLCLFVWFWFCFGVSCWVFLFRFVSATHYSGLVLCNWQFKWHSVISDPGLDGWSILKRRGENNRQKTMPFCCKDTFLLQLIIKFHGIFVGMNSGSNTVKMSVKKFYCTTGIKKVY